MNPDNRQLKQVSKRGAQIKFAGNEQDGQATETNCK